eukprot:m.386580 g.386580  ORF g.386580 m.386580 type:complete len:71 (+) comp20055_c1_seq3:2741-2953(+)
MKGLTGNFDLDDEQVRKALRVALSKKVRMRSRELHDVSVVCLFFRSLLHPKATPPSHIHEHKHARTYTRP